MRFASAMHASSWLAALSIGHWPRPWVDDDPKEIAPGCEACGCEAVAKVGEEVRMGGGQITREEAGLTPGEARYAFEEKRGELSVPDGCRGPLWVSSGVVR